MDMTLGFVVIGAVVAVALLGAWAVGRYRRDKADVPDAGKRSPEELTARENLKKLKDAPDRYGNAI
jgi:hypothetical protein